MSDSIVVSIAIVTQDPNEVTKAVEVLARSAAGLALEGISVNVSVQTVRDDDA